MLRGRCIVCCRQFERLQEAIDANDQARSSAHLQGVVDAERQEISLDARRHHLSYTVVACVVGATCMQVLYIHVSAQAQSVSASVQSVDDLVKCHVMAPCVCNNDHWSVCAVWVMLLDTQKKLDIGGIEPTTFRMRSGRSTTELNAR